MILSVLLAVSSLASQAQDYNVPWCQTVGHTLQSYLAEGYSCSTYEEEKKVLEAGVQRALELTNEKFHFYFRTSLLLSKTLLSTYQNAKDQVLFLREGIGYALNDLRYFDRYLWSCRSGRCEEGNHREFVLGLLHRGINLGIKAKKLEQEVTILKFSSQSALELLENSDYSRSYYCAIEVLRSIDTTPADVYLLRDQVKLALDRLENYQRYQCRGRVREHK